MVAAAIALAALMVPGAGWNALARWAAPLAEIDRYTFTQLAELPESKVIPLGESVTMTLPLAESSPWRPKAGRVRYEGQTPIAVRLSDSGYEVELPPQTDPGELRIAIGDATRQRDDQRCEAPHLGHGVMPCPRRVPA